MEIRFFYGGYGTYEKEHKADWPANAPLPREGEIVYLMLPANQEIVGEVKRVSYYHHSQTEKLEIRIRLD